MQTTFLHSGWEFIQTSLIDKKVAFSYAEWLPAQVPGHVHLDLVENGVIADPFERMNELGCQWVDEADWSYRCTFDWSPQEGLPKRVLRFEGLDTVCTVFLNDEKLAEHDNMFVPLELDVTDRLIEGTNELRVDFLSAARIGRERQETYFRRQGLDPEKVGRFGERAFVRKAQYMYGWDWGPRLVSCGIWKPVTLLEYQARFLDVHAVAEPLGDHRWRLTVESEVEGEGTPVFTIVGTADGEEATLTGNGSLDLNVDEEAVGVLVFAELEDQDDQTVMVPLRTVRLLREPDAFGESFELEVNGQKVWARGFNWIPDHSFPSALDKTRLVQRLQQCKDMGVNLLRVWGGGLYESDEFYEICWEMGIMVWQDFPFACGFYPDTDEYVEAFRKEAEVNVRRLRNQPALVMWCGNNENHQCYADRWAGDKTPPRFYGEHFYHGVIPETLAKLDSARPYTPGSACGPKDAPLEHVNQGGYGDSHYWDVWHGRGDWRFYADSTARFSSEFGFVSSCSLECWESCLDAEDWEVRSPAVRWHDKTGKGYETYVGYVELHYPKAETLEDWVYYSQLNQRDALRFGVEHFRRSEFCKGTLVWQVNDCWPVQSWAVIDSLANWKAAAYEMVRLYDDVLFSISRDNEKAVIWLVNDLEESFDLEDVQIDVMASSTLTGEALRRWEGKGHAEAGKREPVMEIDLSGLNVNETLLTVSVGAKEMAWALLGEPKNARFATPAEIVVSTYEADALTLKIPGPVVDLQLLEDGSTRPFAQNFITQSSAGLVTVPLRETVSSLSLRSLAGEHPVRVTRSPLG